MPQQKRQRLMTHDEWTPQDVKNWLVLCGFSMHRARYLLGVTGVTMTKFCREGLTEWRSRRTVLAMRYLLEHAETYVGVAVPGRKGKRRA